MLTVYPVFCAWDKKWRKKVKYEIPVKIDHVGLFSNNFHPADVMFKLGFSGEGGCAKMPLDENGQPPRCMRFVMDNCYLEFAINRDSHKYGGAIHGTNYLEFASTDIVRTRDNAAAQGFMVSDLVHATRYADHGEKKGTAIFDCVAVKDDVIPNVEVESVCHATRELFYNNNRFIHANGINRVSNVLLCCDDEGRVKKIGEDLAKFDKGLGDWGEGTAIRTITFCDRKTLQKELGVVAPEDARNTVGVVLETPDYEKTSSYFRKFNGTVRENGYGILVDLVEKQNMFFIVPKR